MNKWDMKLSMPVPAICPICNVVFASPIALGEGTSGSFKNMGAGPCPNGHMGYIPDGEYSLRNGLMRIVSGDFGRKLDIGRIKRIAESALNEDKEAQESAIDQISALLPEESRAAIKQLGSNSPVTAIMVILFLIAGIASQAGTAYQAFFPNDPPPNTTTIINNNYNTTIINGGASAGPNENTVDDAAAGERQDGGIEHEGNPPPKDDAQKKRSSQKPKSRRRQDVKRARREALKTRRKQFPRVPHR